MDMKIKQAYFAAPQPTYGNRKTKEKYILKNTT